MGIANATAPLYLSEVVPVAIRGRVVACINIMNLLSGVVATCVVFATSERTDKLSYEVPLAVQCALPGLLIPPTMILPESPQWLIGKDKFEQALAALRKLRGNSDAEVADELRVMKLCQDNERSLTNDVSFWNIFDKQNIKRTITAGSFFSFNQISGVFLSTTYATVFLQDINVASPFALTIIAACCTLAGCCVAPLVIERLGRRPLAMSGMGMLFILDVIAGGLAFRISEPSYAVGVAACSFMFNFFWGASFYSLSNVMPSEIPTTKLRSYTMSYTIAWAQTTAVITTVVVPQITAADAGGLGAKTYLVSSIMCLPALPFVPFADYDIFRSLLAVCWESSPLSTSCSLRREAELSPRLMRCTTPRFRCGSGGITKHQRPRRRPKRSRSRSVVYDRQKIQCTYIMYDEEMRIPTQSHREVFMLFQRAWSHENINTHSSFHGHQGMSMMVERWTRRGSMPLSHVLASSSTSSVDFVTHVSLESIGAARRAPRKLQDGPYNLQTIALS